jgi:hypothetical protein
MRVEPRNNPLAVPAVAPSSLIPHPSSLNRSVSFLFEGIEHIIGNGRGIIVGKGCRIKADHA